MFPFAKSNVSRTRLVVAALTGLAIAAGCEGRHPTEVTSRDVDPVGAHGGPQRAVAAGQSLKVYVDAYPNDWALFMSDRVAAGLQAAPNVVWIYVSAGDINRDTTFWHYRERAAQAAMDVMLPPGNWTCGTQAVQGHPIRQCSKGLAVAYFMRMPDGARSGEGYNGRGAMGMLRDGQITSMTALDGSTTYTSWTDLYTTIRGIIDLEGSGQGAPYVEVHAPDYDRTANYNDSPDNFAVADAINAASATRSWNVSWYLEQVIQTLAINLPQASHDTKERAFLAYDDYMGSGGYGHNRYEPEYQAYLWRTYFRNSVSVPVPPPAAPTGLAAAARSATRVDLTWSGSSANSNGYFVERAPDVAGVAGSYAQVASLPATATSYSSTGLTPATGYWFRVRAYNATDFSGYSNSATATTLQLPAAPTALAGVAASTTRINLSWTNNATNQTGFVLQRAPDNAGAPGIFVFIASIPGSTTSYSDTGLGANTTYWYRVNAVNATDSSTFTAPISVATPVGPAAPSGLQAAAASPTLVNLSWTNNSTTLTGNTVERAPDNAGTPGAFAAIATLGATATSYGDASVTQNTRYWYRVRGFTAVDVSAYSAQVSVTTPLSPPGAPSNLVAQALSSSRIDLSWTSNSTNESAFLIERAPNNAGAPGTFVQVASVGAGVTSYSNTGLTATTRYWYRVRATNAAASSAYTAAVSATTLAAPPSLTDVFVHAHQDDWQLFMGDRAYSSVQVATKVVWIYTTAGDGGQNTAYWQTRELAARQSIDALISGGSWSCAAQTINGHAIHRCAKGMAVSYDMRLPNCAMSADGFFGRGCLGDLRDGTRATLVALDSSATYTSWADLYTTLRAIIDQEAGTVAGSVVEVNSPDYDRTLNPANHPDHMSTADAMQQAVVGRSWTVNWFVDYQIKNMPINMSQSGHDIKQLVFYAYDDYMGAAGLGRNRYESDYQAWLWRTYFRTQNP